jgi:hypothetical protein
MTGAVRRLPTVCSPAATGDASAPAGPRGSALGFHRCALERYVLIGGPIKEVPHEFAGDNEKNESPRDRPSAHLGIGQLHRLDTIRVAPTSTSIEACVCLCSQSAGRVTTSHALVSSTSSGWFSGVSSSHRRFSRRSGAVPRRHTRGGSSKELARLDGARGCRGSWTSSNVSVGEVKRKSSPRHSGAGAPQVRARS